MKYFSPCLCGNVEMTLGSEYLNAFELLSCLQTLSELHEEEELLLKERNDLKDV